LGLGEGCFSRNLIKWKEWIEKGVLNHPDRYRNDALFDITADNLIEEKIVDIGGKKALKRLSRSIQSPSATIDLLIFSNKGDLIILSSNILTLNKDGNGLSDKEYKDSPENIGFERVISTLKFSK